MSRLTRIQTFATHIIILFSLICAGLLPTTANTRISLLTCYPGPEIFELYGHEAIRVRTAGVDSVYNFGVFSFSEPNFVYRFVKGQTDYMLAGQDTYEFLAAYRMRGSKVVEQELNLTDAEADSLYAKLRREALPQNRRYRYNYVKDNCATRIVKRIDETINQPVIYSDSLRFGTYRKAMNYYNRNYPWYQLGIDIALGSGIDQPLTGRQEMFVPVEMQKKVAGAYRADGTPLVENTSVLVDGSEEAILPATAWWCSPIFVFTLILIITICICLYDYKHRRITKWWYALWFFAIGCAGTVVSFLVFCSEHEATSPNALIWWLNPLALLVPIFIWFRKLVPLTGCYMAMNCVAVTTLLILWGAGNQSANIAFFPMMLTSDILSATYAIYYFKKSYTIKGAKKGKKYTQPSRRKKRR